MSKAVVSPDVCVNLDSEFSSTSQKAFLTNERNKQNFIDLLACSLQSNGYTVVQSEDDADIDIVSTVIDLASKGKNVTLVGADTDLLILLLYMWNDSMGHIIMKSE